MLVKSCKQALKKAIGKQVLTPFELYTCLLEVGNLVNQPLIGRVPNDPDDGKYDVRHRKFPKACSMTRNVGAETYSQH